MAGTNIVKFFCFAMCVMMFLSQIVYTAPYRDHDNIRDLYEYLMEKQLMADIYEQQQRQNQRPMHRLVRKNTRSPSLRLRFGRRSDPSISQVETLNSSNEDYPYGRYTEADASASE